MKNNKNRNHGNQDDSIVQNKFTAYLISALMGHKLRYLEKKTKLSQYESLDLEDREYLSGEDFESSIEMLHTHADVELYIENAKLRQYLSTLSEQELKIIFMKVLLALSFS